MNEMAGTRPASALKVALALAAVYIVWGSTYLAIRFAIETLPPFLMAGSRFVFAGALLAFALSFDETIVTIFTAGGVQTLPIWIFQSFRLANQVPLVFVAGLVAILLSVLPVYVASRITHGEVAGRM